MDGPVTATATADWVPGRLGPLPGVNHSAPSYSSYIRNVPGVVLPSMILWDMDTAWGWERIAMAEMNDSLLDEKSCKTSIDSSKDWQKLLAIYNIK